MQNLFRRPSGIYFLRPAVPVQLRQVFGQREIVATTGALKSVNGVVVTSVNRTIRLRQ